MSKQKESLKANESEILASLPKEFQEDFKTTTVTDPVKDSSIEDKVETSAIKAELVSNPSIDESASSSDLKDISSPD